MIAFQCPQCDKPLKARPEMAGARCKCTGCKAACLVPAKPGEPAQTVFCSVKIPFRELPLTAAALPSVCICCGRDAVSPCSLVTVWSHQKSGGKKVAEEAGKAVGYLLGGALGFGLAGALAGPEPIPLFKSIPTCERCKQASTEKIRLTGIEGNRLIVEGVPSRFAIAVAEQLAREAEAFEATMLGEPDANQSSSEAPEGDQGGFDWTSIK